MKHYIAYTCLKNSMYTIYDIQKWRHSGGGGVSQKVTKSDLGEGGGQPKSDEKWSGGEGGSAEKWRKVIGGRGGVRLI